MSTQGRPAVMTVTAAVSGPVSSNAMPSVTTGASMLPASSSTIVTTVSIVITSVAVAVQAENLPMPVCSEMGVSQLPNSAGGMEETITPVPEDALMLWCFADCECWNAGELCNVKNKS